MTGDNKDKQHKQHRTGRQDEVCESCHLSVEKCRQGEQAVERRTVRIGKKEEAMLRREQETGNSFASVRRYAKPVSVRPFPIFFLSCVSDAREANGS